MSKFNRFGISALVFLLAAAFLFANGQSESARASSGSGQVKLSVVYFYTSDTEKAVFQSFLAEFQKQNPNIGIDTQVVTQAKWQEIMQTRAVAGNYPDVAMAVLQNMGQWASSGLLQPADQYLAKDFIAKFIPARLVPDTFQGHLVGLPMTIAARAVAYNVNYYSDAGIKPPTNDQDVWTWEQLVTMAKKAKNASGAKYPLQFEKPSFDGWVPFLYEAGGHLTKNNFSQPDMNSPEARHALEWTRQLHADGVAAPGIIDGTEDSTRLFASGVTTTWLATGNYIMDRLAPQMKNYDFSFTFLPKDKRQATTLGGIDLIVFKGKHPAEAWSLVRFLSDTKNMAQFNKLHTSIPPRTDVTVQWPIKPELAKFFAKQSEQVPNDTVEEQIQPFYSASRSQLLQELGTYVSGQESLDSATKNMNSIIASNIKK